MVHIKNSTNGSSIPGPEGTSYCREAVEYDSDSLIFVATAKPLEPAGQIDQGDRPGLEEYGQGGTSPFC
jgi:hypothetical protein